MSPKSSTAAPTPTRPLAPALLLALTLPLAPVLVAGSAGCEGGSGTIAIRVVTAPGSDLPERIGWVRLTLDDPPTVVEAAPDSGELSLEITADGQNGFLTLEGFAAQGDATPIAIGRTGILPIAAIDADIVVYVAPPMSLAQTPEPMDPPRRAMGVAPLSFGALFAGGIDADGRWSSEVGVYSVYQHTFLRDAAGDRAVNPIGVNISECTTLSPPDCAPDTPRVRIRPIVTAGATGDVYIFGGVDEDGDPSSEGWRLSPSAPPRGLYTALSNNLGGRPSLGAQAALHGNERLVVTGAPPLEIDGITLQVRPFTGALGPLQGTATSTLIDGRFFTLFAGEGTGERGVALLADGRFESDLAPPADIARRGHATVALPGGDFLVVGGETEAGLATTAIRVHSITEQFTSLANFLTTPRRDAAVAATDRYVVVAGGTEGCRGESDCPDVTCSDAGYAPLGDAEVFAIDDEGELVPMGAIGLVVPRRGAHAIPLVSGNVLIAGGCDDAGEPIAELELFTPAGFAND